MKVICISIGTRGDIEPFAALSELLISAGHEVICAFPAQFEKQAKQTGADFFPLSKDFLEMLESSTGKMALGGGGSFIKKIKAFYGLYTQNKRVSFELLKQQKELIESENPDLILHSLKAFYPVYRNINYPGKSVLISPIPCVIHPVNEMSSIFLNGKDYGKHINRWSYKLMRRLSMNYLTGQLKRTGVKEVSAGKLTNAWVSEKLIFTISPSLYPQRSYWPSQVRVLGYLERDKTMHWSPPDPLLNFLSKHPSPLFITFGSMTNPHPEEKTKFVLDVLKENAIPAIINVAAGGLYEPDLYDREHVYFVDDIPYDWIFPKVRAVIHHGGAGTTHLALKYGCASMIVPHIPDQRLWNRIISQADAGPRGPSISKFTQGETKEKIVDLFTNNKYLENACKIGERMSREDMSDEILKFLSA